MNRLRSPSFLASLRTQGWLVPGLIVVLGIVPLVLFVAGVGVRKGLATPVVINEVYPNAQAAQGWLELYNATGSLRTLTGYTIGNSRGIVARLDAEIAPGALLVVRPDVGGWNPKGDAAVLRDPKGKVVDSIAWGTNTRLNVPNKQAITRNPQGLDSNTNADWRGAPPSAGVQSPASLSVGLHRVLFAATNYISVIAGFLLWGAFLLIGLIARRFETLTGQRAFWLAMVIAPVGIVIYNAIQAYAFFTVGNMTDCSRGLNFALCQQGWAFVPLLLSGAAMVYVVYRFYGLAHQILDLKGA